MGEMGWLGGKGQPLLTYVVKRGAGAVDGRPKP